MGARVQTDLLRLAEQAGCTAKEIEVLELRERGLSLRRVAVVLDLSLSTVRDRLDRAARNIARVARDSD